MYNKSGSRNKQNKAIEKTTTEKKETKREREEAAKGTCNILAMRFISFFGCNCLQSTEGFSRTHTPSYAHTHTHILRLTHTHILAHKGPMRCTLQQNAQSTPKMEATMFDVQLTTCNMLHTHCAWHPQQQYHKLTAKSTEQPHTICNTNCCQES